MTFYAPLGYRLAGLACGLKRDGRPDIALLVSDQPCAVAGVFTTNRVKAAPVLRDQALLARPEPTARAVLINTGSANACTGQRGLDDAHASAAQVADLLGCSPDEVLTLSTGVIGLPLDMEAMERGIAALVPALRPDGWADAAAAIMTTDTRPKLASVRLSSGAVIAGMAKGAGMIAPHMATMLAVIGTDAALTGDVLAAMLREAVAVSFNRIVVDGDMSTNDTVLLLANGAAGPNPPDHGEFQAALTTLCIELAQAIVRDGEGATKFVTVQVTGAGTQADAHAIARQIATSPLVKTAFYGADPNWGRILAAAGYAGVEFDPARLSLWLLDERGTPVMQLVSAGEPADYDEQAAIALMRTATWGVCLDLGQGAASSQVWTCDLSHDYVSINGHYRT
ncbi:MAG: bifunctional glutamate N-acetyltransferase/amino-acid acetyltransferase ArgJ [Anaerolineae bacterium]